MKKLNLKRLKRNWNKWDINGAPVEEINQMIEALEEAKRMAENALDDDSTLFLERFTDCLKVNEGNEE